MPSSWPSRKRRRPAGVSVRSQFTLFALIREGLLSGCGRSLEPENLSASGLVAQTFLAESGGMIRRPAWEKGSSRRFGRLKAPSPSRGSRGTAVAGLGGKRSRPRRYVRRDYELSLCLLTVQAPAAYSKTALTEQEMYIYLVWVYPHQEATHGALWRPREAGSQDQPH